MMDMGTLIQKVTSADNLGPMQNMLRSTSRELKLLEDTERKHWICKGKRSLGIATNLLMQNEVIAIPTDTVYGFAVLASDTIAIQKLYKVKGRDIQKPLCISVGGVGDIKTWSVTSHLPPKLLSTILPGPYTIVLQRTPNVNIHLNPGIDTIGIRVPRFKFINDLAKVVGPLALTSANLSSEPSCLVPTEFEKLWPELGGIFHASIAVGKASEYLRKGSTIVDLSYPGYYKIVRSGIGKQYLINMLKHYKIEPYKSD
ncbi:threonyl-carbamoyl synthesis 1 [Calliopsis andreniformis]|uniref:threonyl-carbamoyl synthesis 1 n=1 Tax=Calliopsis andreniformis TaxID=337506 RepID=UPI003FCE33D8